MGRFGPVVRFVDGGDRTSRVDEKDAKNAKKIDRERACPVGTRREFRLLLSHCIAVNGSNHSELTGQSGIVWLAEQYAWSSLKIRKRITIRTQTTSNSGIFQKIFLTALRFS